MKEPASSHLVLRTIRAVVGDAGMRDLRAEIGGMEIWIPRECGPDHWMSRLFGEKSANKICGLLSVINADGAVVGNLRCYVPLINSRIDALFGQIEEEVKQELIAGKAVRDVAREVGVSERRVRSHLKFLREKGVLPHPKSAAKTPYVLEMIPDEEVMQARMLKAVSVDEYLIAGRTNKSIITALGVSLTLVRKRRQILLADDRLPVGRRAAFDEGPEEDRS